MVINNLKCHGAFSPLILERSRSVGASLDDANPARSMLSPHTGQRPSVVSAEGAKYREHGSHHGMLWPHSADQTHLGYRHRHDGYPCSERVRTRNLIGVEPNSNASRIDRSR